MKPSNKINKKLLIELLALTRHKLFGAMSITIFMLFANVLIAQDASTENWVENSGFEEGSLGLTPKSWRMGVLEYPGVQASEATHTGSAGLMVRWIGKNDPNPNSPGTLIQVIDATQFRGQSIRLSAFGRIPVDNNGVAQLWLRVDGVNRFISLSNNDVSGRITGTEWKEYEILVAVPEEAMSVAFGVFVVGTGPIYLDDFTLTIVQAREQRNIPPAPISRKGLVNLIAFTRLYGYVRFFHPSDEAANADWLEIALVGISRVENADGAEELRTTLLDIFSPVAPSLQIDRKNVSDKPSLPTSGTQLTWLRQGSGLGSSEVYRSARVLAPDSQPQVATLKLPIGLAAHVPLRVSKDKDGHTIPIANAPLVTNDKPEGFKPSGNDRTSRLASIVIAWNLLQHFYPYWDTANVDWLEALSDCLSRAAIDPSAEHFDITMQRLIASLHDGHGRANRTSSQEIRGTLPLQWEWIQGSLVVTAASNTTGLQIGDVVTAIDGTPVKILKENWSARVSAATPGWQEFRELQEMSLGTVGQAKTVTVERTDGAKSEIKVKLEQISGYPPAEEKRPETVSELQPGLAYIDLTRLDEKVFAESLAMLAAYSALVIDMRGYPTDTALKVLQHLTDQPLTSAHFRIPIYMSPDQQNVTFDESGSWRLSPLKPRFKATRVAFLVDSRVISYAESIMGIVESYSLGEIVGSPTAGTNGNVDQFRLPTGHLIMWTGMQVLKHDGSQHHGIGIKPTIPAKRTLNGVKAGRDEILEAGVTAVISN